MRIVVSIDQADQSASTGLGWYLINAQRLQRAMKRSGSVRDCLQMLSCACAGGGTDF